MSKISIPSIALCALFITGCSIVAPQPSNTTTKQNTQVTSQSETTKASLQIKKDASSTEQTSTNTQKSAPVYLDYSKELYDSLKGKEPVALFFHASWCPICQRMEKNFKADLASFPAGTKILKIDYDKETELKKEYGIKVQSTIVVLDGNGNVTMTAQDPDFDDLKKELQQYL